MEKHALVCDQCGREIVTLKPTTFGGGNSTGMITVTKACGRSEDLIGTGAYHFCSDRHLLVWLKEKEEERK